MVDKTTPRLGLPVPYLTNPLKIDVGKLTDALTMLDKNAVMLTDWDITSDSWQKMGKISNLAQGKIAITLMVVTGTGFANIVMQTGDGSVTTVGDPARITVTAQTNLGANSATILGGKLVEVAADTYEIWFNIAPSTAPRKWTGLLIAGNGATIDWTHSSGAQPIGGVALNIARSLTDQEIASPTITRDGAVLTAGYAGLMGIKLPYFDFAATGDTITSHVWRVGETMRVKAADATTANGFPATITGAGATAWRIHCEGINEDRTSTVFIFASEGATPTWVYRITRTTTNWSAPRRMYTSDNPPAASEVKAVAQMDGISTVINLNDRILPAHYGVVSLTSAAGAVAANNFPFDEPGQLTVFPFGASGGVTQVYIAKSGRIASRSYDGSVFTDWRKGAQSGVNSDITQLTGLQGPLTLNADAAGDYDAVTLRQLKANSGGSGPTMNGVLNNFIGAVEWFNGSRAKLPPGYVPADGQTLQRSAYPDLWAAISSNFLNSVTEAQWNTQSSNARGSFYYNRGSYSLGDGSTTFRVPDLNGGQTGSITNTFLNGSAPSLSSNVGQVRESAAPNITGNLQPAYAGSVGIFDAATGPFSMVAPYVAQTANFGSIAANSSGRNTIVTFDASRSDKVYTGSAGEIRPNTAVGIWIIRVSGAFQSANTNFSVIAGDATAPGANTSVLGGLVYSRYTIGGVDKLSASLVASGRYVTTESSMVGMAVIQAKNEVSGAFQNLIFDTNGDLAVPRYVLANNIKPYTGNRLDISALVTCNDLHTAAGGGCGVRAYENNDIELNNATGTIGAGYFVNWVQGKWYNAQWRLGATRDAGTSLSRILLRLTPTRDDGTANSYRDWSFNPDGALLAQGAYINSSDGRIKSDLKPVQTPLKAVLNWRGLTYLKEGQTEREVGLVAQDVQEWCPEAVKVTEIPRADGSVMKDGLALNYSGVTAAYHTEAIKTLVDLLELALTNPEEAKARIADLKK